MKWTKQHSKNAVAAKARKRLERALWAEPETEPAAPVATPRPSRRKGRAVITLQIRDHEIGDSLTLNLHRSPWPNLWTCDQGQFGSASLGQAVKLILLSAGERQVPKRKL